MTRLELCVYFYHSAELSKQRNQSIRKQNRPFCRCSFQKQVFEYVCLACSSSFKHWNITQAEHVLILNWTCLAQASERARDLKQLLGECSEIFSEIGNYKFDSIPHHCVLPRRMISECFNYSATEREFFFPAYVNSIRARDLLKEAGDRFVQLLLGQISTRISGGFK